MRIGNYDVNITPKDLSAIEYYCGNGTESFTDYVNRVFSLCEMYSNNNGLDEQGNKLSSVYSKDPQVIIENKVRRRKQALVSDVLGLFNVSDAELEAKVTEARAHPNYETQDDRMIRVSQEQTDLNSAYDAKVLTNIELLRNSGMSDEVIKLVYPEAQNRI